MAILSGGLLACFAFLGGQVGLLIPAISMELQVGKENNFSAESKFCWLKTCASENIFPKILDLIGPPEEMLRWDSQLRVRCVETRA